MIHLTVGRLTVDHGKNEYFADHGPLFQASDLKPVPSYYASENWPEGDQVVEFNEGFGKSLGQVVDRLELLGYTMPAVKHLYSCPWRGSNPSRPPAPFDRLRRAIAEVDVTRFKGKYREGQPAHLLNAATLRRLAYHPESYNIYHPGLQPDHWEVDLILESFDPYARLRLLAQNQANLPLDVNWDFTPLIESGWAERGQFKPGALPEQKFLVVTEGSSDSKILSKALELYRPHIADFFTFVDMEEGYPFSGTGNLHRFAQGLISIGVHNKTVVVYDNDAEGSAKMRETEALRLPSNMRVTKLPVHRDFRKFKTVGPGGRHVTDINGKAASIECYLDLLRKGLPVPVVRWTSFNKELGHYQGELQHKTQYMKEFLNLRRAEKSYDYHRIDAVLDALIRECVSIAEGEQLSVLHIKPSL